MVAPTATPSCHLERPKAERRRGGEVVAARKSRRRRRRLIPNNSRAHLDEAPSTENRPSKCSYFTGGEWIWVWVGRWLFEMLRADAANHRDKTVVAL